MRKLIRSNSLRLVVLLWFAGWLIMVMPGHKRGIVQLPNAEVQSVAAEGACCEPKSCCEPAPPSCCSSKTPTQAVCQSDTQDAPVRDGETPPGDPAKHCAICFLKAHMTDPPPVMLYSPYLGELDELVYMTESSVASSQAAPARVRGRAPPA